MTAASEIHALRQKAERDGWRRARSLAAHAMRDRLRLPPKLTMSQWANRHRVLSPESSAEPGPWRNEKVPHAVGIMDAISGTEFNDFTIVAPSQFAKTEIGVNNPAAYYIDQEPSPILVIQPNVKPMAEAWSKERLAPMIRDSPRLRGKVKDARARDSGNTILQKSFPGGFIAIMGANSPAGLASRPIRVVLCDELDRWEASAGSEGDPLSLAVARTKTFRHRRKVVKVSSPGNEGESRIEKEFDAGNQQHRYVPCPHCSQAAGELAGWQILEWRDSNGKPGIKPGKGDFRFVWHKELNEAGETVHHPHRDVGFLCKHCGALIEETAKPWMAANAKWVAHNPSSRRQSWHVPFALSPWVRWGDLAEKWLLVKDDAELRKTFYNTDLGLLYVVDAEQPDVDKLAERREPFPSDKSRDLSLLVPRSAATLTMAVDVQGDRLEAAVWAWGDREESWLIHFERLEGDPEQEEVWERLEGVLNRTWEHEAGAEMRIERCAVDSGHLKDVVYRWVKPREARGVYAVFGSDQVKEPLNRGSKNNKEKVKVFTFHPTSFKDLLFPRLRRVVPGPGYLHFGTLEQTGVDDAFLKQFAAEKRVVDYVKNAPVVKYLRIARRRNEAIDLYNMGLVALRIRGMTFVRSLPAIAEALARRGAEERAKREAAPPATAAQPAAPAQPPARRKQSSYVNGLLNGGGKRW